MDDLLDHLVADLAPVRPRTAWRDALPLAVLGAVELALFLGAGMARSDIHAAMGYPAFWWKLLSFGVIALIGMVTAVSSFDPSVSPKRGLYGAALAAAAAVAVGVAVALQRHASPDLAKRLSWASGIECMVWMTTLSAPMVLALALLMRRGAPTDRRRTALAAGIAAAAWGSFVFVFACGHDDPLYVAVWYGLGCSVTIAYTRLLLARLIRW
jgi:hypothetical protein